MSLPDFTEAEVSRHSTKEDCWMIVHQKVYDLTEYLSLHPGGFKILFKHAGGDCTGDFEGMYHSVRARNILEKYRVGQLKGSGGGLLNPLCTPSVRTGGGGYGPYGLFPKPTTATSAGRVSLKPPVATRINPASWTPCKLIARVQLSHDTHTFRFQCLGRLEMPAISHLSVRVGTAGAPKPYTPTAVGDDYFELTIKVYDTPGAVSKAVHALLLGSSELSVKGPAVTHAFDPEKFSSYTLMAGGSGVTPMLQIIQALASRDTPRPCVLLFSNKTSKDIILRKELVALEKRHAQWLKVFWFVTREAEETPNPAGIELVRSRITQVHLGECSRHFTYAEAAHAFFACGPAAFNSAMEAHATALAGVVSEHVVLL